MSTDTKQDARPPVWVGHVSMRTRALAESEAFMRDLGMRPVFRGEGVAIMELRGGTHLVLSADADAAPSDAPFDLMVDDVEAAHAGLAARGFAPSDISRGRIHDSFTVADPGGARITVNSSHVSDQPV